MNEQNQKGWWSRNWPWALPVGCCSGCLLFLIILVFGFGVAVFSFVDKFVEASPIEDAIEIAQKNKKVVEYLGEDITSNGFPNGNIKMNNDDGEVDFRIPIKGELGEGVLVVRGIRADKKWTYEDLYVVIKETGEKINLLEHEKIPDGEMI